MLHVRQNGDDIEHRYRAHDFVFEGRLKQIWPDLPPSKVLACKVCGIEIVAGHVATQKDPKCYYRWKSIDVLNEQLADEIRARDPNANVKWVD